MTWEYMLVNERLAEEQLNEFGAEGWELLHCTWNNGWVQGCVFKRQIGINVELIG